MDALVLRMEQLLESLEGAGDPARFFLGTYLRTTRAVGAALAAGRFEDPAWVVLWDVDFAGFYLDALELHRKRPEEVPAPWRRAFGADPGLPPEAHVLLGMNAHINFDLPQSLIAVIPPEDFGSSALLERRRRDHERIDDVLAARVGEEDLALQRAGGRRTPLDRLLAPVNRQASRLFLREARRKVWANTAALHAARLQGEAAYVVRLADLEAVSAERVADLLRPGPVLVRLALHGFGVTLD
ncbi:DUF5995 family protein [Blastococcus sp. SYSU D00922]